MPFGNYRDDGPTEKSSRKSVTFWHLYFSKMCLNRSGCNNSIQKNIENPLPKYLANVRLPKLEKPGFAAGTVETHGPIGCFGAVLFIEKEGFLPLFEKVQLAERYDLAIMST